MKYGKSAKVLTFQKNTAKKTDYQFLNDTITEPSPSRRVSDYYREEWPMILGSIIGTTVMFGVIWLAGTVIHG